MDKQTKKRLNEIRQALKKYGLDKVLGQTAKNIIDPRSDDIATPLLEDELPKKLRLMFQELGTTYIKLGQLLSTRPDMVGVEISNELAKLQDDNPSISYEEVKEIVERELDGNIEDVFKDFKQNHIATASIGQVHEAYLKTGERVAVKIQKGGIDETINLDLRIMKYIAHQADRFNTKLKKLNLPGIMDEFDRSIHKEIDYQNELINIEHIEANFKKNPNIHIPKPYPEYSTSKVLTMEFIDGSKLSDVYESNEFDKKFIAQNILNSYLKQIFIDGFFHSDPHPGNMIILENNIVCYIDLGMMGILDNDFKRNLSELMILFMDQDVDGVINQLMYMDILNYNADTKHLKRDLTELFSRYFGVSLNQFNGVLEELLALMQEYGVVLPEEVVNMVRGVSMIENIALNLDPEIDVFASLKPIARKILRHSFDPKKFFKDSKRNIILNSHIIKSLPQLLTRTIHKIEEGELKFKFEIDRIDHVANKLMITIIISALLVSSSLVMTITRGPMLFDMPFIGVIGYILTLILSIIAFFKYVLKK